MATYQELLRGVGGIQENAQNNLPVIPNNGNPGGIHNMPGNGGNTGVVPPNTGSRDSGDFYPWMRPSPAMDWIHQTLQQPLLPPHTRATLPPATRPYEPPPLPVTQPSVPVMPVPKGGLGHVGFGDANHLPSPVRPELPAMARVQRETSPVLPLLPSRNPTIRTYQP